VPARWLNCCWARERPSMRGDYYVYNEAGGWVITSEGLNGSKPIEDQRAWGRELKRGTFVPITLVQDDELVIRVVVDEPLSEQEAEEWIDRFSCTLRVPDGRLMLVGGSEYLEEPDPAEHEDYVRRVEVPPGDYRVTVYSHLLGVNGLLRI